jgi:hypothetical protein
MPLVASMTAAMISRSRRVNWGRLSNMRFDISTSLH